jgi:spore germination protein GerM
MATSEGNPESQIPLSLDIPDEIGAFPEKIQKNDETTEKTTIPGSAHFPRQQAERIIPECRLPLCPVSDTSQRIPSWMRPSAGILECLFLFGDTLDRPFQLRETTANSRTGNDRLARLLQISGLLAVLAAGFWLRSLSPGKPPFRFGEWWPWARTATVTLYFSDGQSLFPVSRRMPVTTELPSAVLRALLAGPDVRSSLKSWIPASTVIRSFSVSGEMANVNLSGAFLEGSSRPELANAAVIETMTHLPGVSSVALSVEGKPVAMSATRMPLLYYGSANGLVARPISASGPRAALDAYLSGPSDSELTGFPADVQLLGYEYSETNRSLSLNFTYTPSIRTLALDKPDRMRLVLLGLIATLTEFPEVRTVQLDFQGQSRLGLGQCSDLLRTPQPRPQLLNDERLLER